MRIPLWPRLLALDLRGPGSSPARPASLPGDLAPTSGREPQGAGLSATAAEGDCVRVLTIRHVNPNYSGPAPWQSLTMLGAKHMIMTEQT
jgi:hypothetical protein